jgi:hypothetical protein
MDGIPPVLPRLEPALVVEFGVSADPAVGAGRLGFDGAEIIHVSNRSQVTRELIEAGANRTVDLVIDHAAADRAQTVPLFEAAFGLLDAGGHYVIEGTVDDELAVQLSLATLRDEPLIRSVDVRRGWTVIASTGVAFGSTTPISSAYTDPFRLIAAHPQG